MKQVVDVYFVTQKYNEKLQKYKVDFRNSKWQHLLMFCSSELLTSTQGYMRTSAKELASMVSNGTLDMERVTIVTKTIEEQTAKAFIKPECTNVVLDILHALQNTFGLTGVYNK